MLSGIYIAIFSALTPASCLFAFLVGRCGRKLPFLDDRIPWTMRRGQAISDTDDTWTVCKARSTEPPPRSREGTA